jgi:hypothetical protein
MLNEDHKLNNLSEQSVSGANESTNYLDKTSSITCVNYCSGNTGASAAFVLQDGRQRNSHPKQPYFMEKAETRENGIWKTENLKYGPQRHSCW